MRWRRTAALVSMVASAIAVGATLAATPAAASAPGDAPCPLDPETGECMPDRDRDGKSDTIDNCPDAYNPWQEDNDRDGIGNACDSTPNGGGGGDDGSGGGGGGGGGSSACPTGDGVFFYQHVDYQGGCFKLTKDVNHGFYFTGVGNNQLSSVRIVGPYSVTLYVDEWYGGGSLTLTASSPNPSTWTGGPSNDNVSSAKLLLDADHDAVADAVDNCGRAETPLVFNPDQADSNRDGYGDMCDVEYLTDGESATVITAEAAGVNAAVGTACFRLVHRDAWRQLRLWKAIELEIRARICHRQGKVESVTEVSGDAIHVQQPYEWQGASPGFPRVEVAVDKSYVQLKFKGGVCVHLPLKGCLTRKRYPWIEVTFWAKTRTQTSSHGID